MILYNTFIITNVYVLICQKKVRNLRILSALYPHIWNPDYTKDYKFLYYKLIKAAKKLRNYYLIKNVFNKSETMWNMIHERHGKVKTKNSIDKIEYTVIIKFM
jgi:hypothetical protein